MRRLLTTLALSTALCATPALAAPEDDYTELREEVWQATLDASPQLATSVGDRRGDGRLGDISIEEYDRRVAQTRDFLTRLNAIDVEALPQDLQVDYAILKRSFEDSLAGAQFDQSRYMSYSRTGAAGSRGSHRYRTARRCSASPITKATSRGWKPLHR